MTASPNAIASDPRLRDAGPLYIVIPAAFSPRESGEGIQCLLYERHWVPAEACPRMLESGAGTTRVFGDALTYFGTSFGDASTCFGDCPYGASARHALRRAAAWHTLRRSHERRCSHSDV